MAARALIQAIGRRAASLVLACCAASAYGGSLAVSPIRVELGEAAPTAALTLENSGNTPMVLQLQVMRWTAAGAEDVYQPSDELVAMPPITTVAPGERQIVRMGLSRGAEAERELAYRLYIEEVPPPPQPGYQGLQVALRVGVPVFVMPATAAAPRLEWQARRGGAESVVLHVTNAGNAHQRLLRLGLHARSDGRPLATQQAVGDLLPGQSREWRVELGRAVPADGLKLTVETDRGPVDVVLDVDAP